MENKHPHFLLVSAAFAAVLCGSACSRQSQATRHLDRAERYYAAARYDDAEIELKNAVQRDPRNATALGRLGSLYLEEGRGGQSLPFLAAAKEMQPDNIEVRTRLGQAMLACGLPAEARKEALAVLDLKPADREAPIILADSAQTPRDVEEARQRLASLPAGASVLVARAHLALKQNQAPEAEKLFEAARAADPKYPQASAGLAIIAWGRKDLANADAAFKAAADASPLRSPLRLQYVQFKLQTGDVAGAARLLDDLIRQAPDFIPGLLWRGEIALTQKEFAVADSLVGKALARDNVNPESLMLSARIQMAGGAPEKAVSILERMVGMYQRSPIAHYQLGLAYVAKGDRVKAGESLHRAVNLAPDMTIALMALAELDIQNRDFTGAIALLSNVIKRTPDNVAAHVLLGEAYRGLGDLDSAVSVYTQLGQRFPKLAQAPYLRGMTLLQQNKSAPAREALTRAAELAPDSASILEPLVILDARERHFSAARARADALVARLPKAAAPVVLRAKVAIAENDMATAETLLRRAIAAEPDSSAAYVLLARVYATSKDYDSAIANLQTLIARNGRDTQAMTLLAFIHESRSDRSAARDTYERILTVAPNSSIALNNLAYLYCEFFNQPEKAHELAQKAHTLQPTDARATDTLGWIIYRRGQYPQALALLQESAGKLTDEPEAQYHVGTAHYMLGQENLARAAFERAVQKDNPFPGRDDAVRKLAVLSAGVRPTPADRAAVETALQKQPDDAVALCRRSAWALQEGDLAQARASGEAALKASPQNGRANLQLARVLAAQGERDRALSLAKEARTITPDLETTRFLGGLVYQAGDYRWAASLLREAAEKAPDDADIQYDWSLAAYAVGNVADAIAAARRALENQRFTRATEARRFLDLASFSNVAAEPRATGVVQEALKSDPSSVPALMASASLAEARKDWKTAQDAYEKTLARFPDFAPAQKGLAVLYASRVDDVAKAAAVAAKARQAYPNDPAVAKAFGIIVYRKGDYPRAAALLKESSATQPADSELLYYLGMSQHQLKRRAESKQTLQRALELGLRNELAPEARRILASAD